jgi:hypothetical protein
MLADGTVYKGKEVILATVAFYMDGTLEGIVEPFISYLVSVPFSENYLSLENRDKY